MKFHVALDKLDKGWSLTLPMQSQKQGKAFIAEMQRRDKSESNYDDAQMKRRRGSLIKVKKALGVKIYRSTLKGCTGLVNEMFSSYREAMENGSRRRR